MLICPYRLTINFIRVPYLNWALIAVTCVMYPLQMTVGVHSATFREFVLQDWDLMGMIGSLFLHGGIVHLLGNMVFLWVFGNAICSTVGNAAYLPVYLLLGVGASAMHLAFSSAPAIGASGAISGIMGMSLILFPVSPLKCGYVFFLPFFGLMRAGKFTARAFWMISFWFIYDIAGALLGGGGVAYWAHIGGFLAGMLAAVAMLVFGLVATFDPTLTDVIKGRAQGQ